MIKLHIGCGKRYFGNEWIHIDGADYPHIKFKNVTKLEFENKSVDLIYSSHLIEYFDREEIKNVLTEWYRVLKFGGILRVAVPDFRQISILYCCGMFPLKNFLGPLYGKINLNDQTIYHKTVYDFESLEEVLKNIGFKDVKKYDWKNTEHSHIDDHSQAYLPHMNKETGFLISLNIECYK